MPYYDYQCDDCGPFTAVRPMAEAASDCGCPECGGTSPRTFLRAPNMSLMASSVRSAHATNEKARHEPKVASRQGHGPGCSCCSGKGKSKAVFRADGSKTFPSARPWQISH
ncbi:MAG: zinc ribbon domain-containing protein [Rhizobiales bacterium]|nr:zinc ribbon domain-containing protein [Hyphomicrobiales bacterium]